MSVPASSVASPKTPRFQDRPIMLMVHKMPSSADKPQGIVVPVQYIVPQRANISSKRSGAELPRLLPAPSVGIPVQASTLAPQLTATRPTCSQIPIVNPEVNDFSPQITSVVGSYTEPSGNALAGTEVVGATGTEVVGVTDHCYFKDVAMEIEQADDSNAPSEDATDAETTVLAASCRAVEKDHNYKKIPSGAECRVSCSLDFDNVEEDETRKEDHGGSHATYRKKVLEVPVDTKEDQENLQREIRIHKGTLQKVTAKCRRSKATLRTQKGRLKLLQNLLFSERTVQRDGRDVVEVTLSKYAMEVFADGGFPKKDGELWGAKEVVDDGVHSDTEQLETSDVPTSS